MNKAFVIALALVALVALPGCKSSAEKAQAKEQQHQQQQAALKASIPADSPLAKIELGMNESEVTTILGQPTSQDAHITGKQFIPFNFAAKDTMRTVYYYKGIGSVQFSSGSWGQRNGVVELHHDTSEPGHKR